MRGEAALSTSSVQLVDMHAERRHRSRRNLITCSRHWLQMFSTEPREEGRKFLKMEVMMCKACSRVLNDVLHFLKFHQRFTVNGRGWRLTFKMTSLSWSRFSVNKPDFRWSQRSCHLICTLLSIYYAAREPSSRLQMKKTPSVSKSTFISFVC